MSSVILSSGVTWPLSKNCLKDYDITLHKHPPHCITDAQVTGLVAKTIFKYEYGILVCLPMAKQIFFFPKNSLIANLAGKK